MIQRSYDVGMLYASDRVRMRQHPFGFVDDEIIFLFDHDLEINLRRLGKYF
jgi:hypothetical protein